MKGLPLDIGTIHFVGIGGIGMSGIAEVLYSLGYTIQGSDSNYSQNVKRLEEIGITIFIGHKIENIKDAGVVVVSSAIGKENPEVEFARQNLIPVVRRAEMLAELMRLKWSVAVGGTHGKTTTTSLIASLFDRAKLDPTVINGGILNAWGSNARLGGGEWMVVEADESDGTFVKLPATIAVVTNINVEHMDHYGSFSALQTAFEKFVKRVPFYGFAVLCIDDPQVQAMIPRILEKKIITYGSNPQADIRLSDLKTFSHGSNFSVEIAGRLGKKLKKLGDLFLPMHGEHNVKNALAAIAIANEMGITYPAIKGALKNFKGVKRRFTKTGEVNGIQIIDDYGHHPVEIASVLKASRRVVIDGKVIAVVQPHRYTRLRDLFEEFCKCFNDADAVIVTDVYPAGEAAIKGFDRINLVEGLRSHGHRKVFSLEVNEDLPELLADLADSGDIVVCLGAGSITNIANSLPQQLSDFYSRVEDDKS